MPDARLSESAVLMPGAHTYVPLASFSAEVQLAYPDQAYPILQIYMLDGQFFKKLGPENPQKR